MLPLLAETAPDGIGEFLGIVFYLVGGIAAAVVLINQFRKPAPTETVLTPQPLHVKPAAEYATKEAHDNLEKKVDGLREEMQDGFAALRDDRSKSVGNLHQKIEQFDIRNTQLTTELRKEMKGDNAELRKEMKEDNAGIHNRITELLAAFSKLQGSVENALKESRHPFDK